MPSTDRISRRGRHRVCRRPGMSAAGSVLDVGPSGGRAGDSTARWAGRSVARAPRFCPSRSATRHEDAMRWSPGADSSNVEDRRGQRGVGMAPMGIGGTVVLLVLSLIFGHNFFADSGQTADQSPAGSAGGEVAPVEQSPEEAKRVQFVTWVLDTAQATWARLLPAMGATYTPAKLVLFRDATNTACGLGESAMGPFYCPRDERVYIDLGFYDELRSRFGAPGDFAQAYVIAHELGHHVQHLLGLDAQVRRAQQGGAPANAL